MNRIIRSSGWPINYIVFCWISLRQMAMISAVDKAPATRRMLYKYWFYKGCIEQLAYKYKPLILQPPGRVSVSSSTYPTIPHNSRLYSAYVR